MSSNIKILDKPILSNETKNLKDNLKELRLTEEETDLTRKQKNSIYKLLNNNNLQTVCSNIINSDYLKKFNYSDLNNMYDTLKDFFENIKEVKNEIDIDIFFKAGNFLDITKLKAIYIKLGRHKIFPNFNFKRLKQLFEKPPRKLKPQDNHTANYINYDPFTIRKYLYAIIQMVVNEMDLVVAFVGGEGTGKSLACSQDMSLLHYLLTQLGLITYKYELTDMWFNSLGSFAEAEDKFFNEKLRILGLDEGNELNRQEWQNDQVKTFFQRLRRERFNQRIKLICLPQLGELLTSIVLSRLNFVFAMNGKNDVTTGTILKGYCKFYIIPRNNEIYSPYLKKNLLKSDIIDILGTTLEDKKKFYKSLPRKILIKQFKRNFVWGFNKKRYDKILKESNKIFTVNKGFRLTEYQAYCYFKSRPNLKDWELNRKENKKMYATLQKMDRSICKIFEEDPQKLLKYEKIFEREIEK